MNRRKSREVAMKLLYEMAVSKSEYVEIIENFKEHTEEDLTDVDFSYVIRTIKGIGDNSEDIDKAIEKYSNKWKVGRISKINLSILRIAIYEIRFENDIPDKVSINEAIELAKKYSEDKSPAFINGILGNMVK